MALAVHVPEGNNKHLMTREVKPGGPGRVAQLRFRAARLRTIDSVPSAIAIDYPGRGR